MGRSYRELPQAVVVQLAAAVTDLEDSLRVLDALYIPTRYPDSLRRVPPTDHFGRLQSSDANSYARALFEAIRLALASP